MGQILSQPCFRFAARFPGWVLLVVPFIIQAAALDNSLIEEMKDNYSRLQDARSVYQQSLREGRLGEQEKADYKSWIRQLDDQVRQDCLKLAATQSTSRTDGLPCDQILASGTLPVELDLNTEKTPAEQSNHLVEEMNRSMGEFDERLLREQDRIRAQKPRTDSEMSSGSATGGAESRNQGEEQQGSAAQTQADEKHTQERESHQAAGEMGDERGRSGEANEGTGSVRQGDPGYPKTGTATRVPDDIPDGHDDDIVARQLREAAEKERDPELREKLWEEYRRYKSGTG